MPAAAFGTRANGTLYAHVLMYRSRGKARSQNATRPSGEPLAVTSAPITKHLVHTRAKTTPCSSGTGPPPPPATRTPRRPSSARTRHRPRRATREGTANRTATHPSRRRDRARLRRPRPRTTSTSVPRPVASRRLSTARSSPTSGPDSACSWWAPPEVPRSQPPPDISLHLVHAPRIWRRAGTEWRTGRWSPWTSSPSRGASTRRWIRTLSARTRRWWSTSGR